MKRRPEMLNSTNSRPSCRTCFGIYREQISTMAVNMGNARYRYEPTPLSSGFIYIMSNAGRSTLYIGVTADLKKRIAAHKEGHGSTFTNAYNLKDLMYYEGFPTITEAIAREKQLKKWHSTWKWNLIKAHNPSFKDLSDEVFGLG